MWWNCGPGGILTNLHALQEIITTHKPHIIHLQDVKISKENAPATRKRLESTLTHYSIYTNSKPKTDQATAHHSVMTLLIKGLTPNLKIITSSSPHTAGRILMFQISGLDAERPIRTANVYFPTSGDTSITRTALERELSHFTETARHHNCRLAIAGDFNAATHTTQRMGYSPSLAITKIDSLYRNFKTRNNLHDAAAHTEYAHTHTWYSHDLHKSAKLDHLLTDATSTATVTLISEPTLSITDHLYSIAHLHPDLGTTHLTHPQTRTPSLNMANRQKLSSLWSSELETALSSIHTHSDAYERLNKAQTLAVQIAEKIYGHTPKKETNHSPQRTSNSSPTS
jgi:exonuclease III